MDFKALMISLGQKLITFTELIRVSVIFMGLPFAMAGAAFALSITRMPVTVLQVIAGTIAVFLVTGAVHTIDDYFDRARDRHLWPDRQIPSRATTPKTALLISLVCFGAGFTFAILFFNIYCVIILLIAAIWATAYTGYLREKYGYMTLPFVIGLFPIGGYIAFTPENLWRDPIPWLLYLMVFFWQSAHILAYSPPHGVEKGKTVVPVLFKRFAPGLTVIFAGTFAGICMASGIIIFFLTNLSYFYLGITIGVGILLICSSVYVSRNLTVKNCMFLVFMNSVYGWAMFLIMTLEFLYRYDLLFFYIVLGFGVLMIALIPVFGGFGEPATVLEKKKSELIKIITSATLQK